MKRMFWPLTLFLLTASAFAAYAQGEIEVSTETVKKAVAALKPGKKAPAALKKKPADKSAKRQSAEKPAEKKPVKKKAKKKPAPPASEYKFKQENSVPTYKFDKRANPIIKDAKPKKKTAKKQAVKAEAPPPDTGEPPGDPIPQKKLPAPPPAGDEDGGF
ncbi:MAG: hypothetical protein HY796_11820 [Elusimicrobia bacterium]|nr:hypothetical protein [Elusimicrobiota bacterium]